MKPTDKDDNKTVFIKISFDKNNVSKSELVSSNLFNMISSDISSNMRKSLCIKPIYLEYNVNL
jgi:hypothetical protein